MRAREGWGKGNIFFGGAFRKAKYEIRRRRNPRSRTLCVRYGAKFSVRIFVKEGSNISQKTPPRLTFREIVRSCLGALRLGMVFFRNFEGIFEIKIQSLLGNAEVPVRKHRENEVFRTNLFSFAFSERLSVFFFGCPKTNFKTIWTT